MAQNFYSVTFNHNLLREKSHLKIKSAPLTSKVKEIKEVTQQRRNFIATESISASVSKYNLSEIFKVLYKISRSANQRIHKKL